MPNSVHLFLFDLSDKHNFRLVAQGVLFPLAINLAGRASFWLRYYRYISIAQAQWQ